MLALFLAACVEPLEPSLTVSPESYAGLPSIVEFTAAGIANTKKSELTGYQFVVADPKGETETFFSKDGLFSHEFGPIGEYIVSVVTADSFGSASSAPVDVIVNVTDPFASSTWSLPINSVYQNQAVTFNASSLAAQQYRWFIYKPSVDPVEDEDNDGFADIPVLSGDGSTLSLSDGIEAELEGYIIVLIIEDQYGNSKTITDLFDVKSAEDPAAAAGVFANLLLADDTIGRKEVTVDGVQPVVYENVSLMLASGESLSGAEDSGLNINQVIWDIYYDGFFFNQIKATSVGDLLWTPDKAGAYQFILRVINNLDNEDEITTALDVVVSENIPTIATYNLSAGPYYEGVEMILDVVASSPADEFGDIVSVKWDIGDLSNDIQYDIIEGDVIYDISWAPYFFESSLSSRVYSGQITVLNAAGRESLPSAFSFTVADNNPVALLTVDPARTFWGKTLSLSSLGSGSNDGDLSSILLELKDQNGAPVILEADNSYILPADTGVGDVTYLAKLTVTNTNGSTVVTQSIDVITPILLATFEPKLESGCNQYFSNQTIILDASGSMDWDESDILRANFEWDITFNGSAYASGRSGAYNGPLSDHDNEGLFKLTLSDAGVYEITLIVYDEVGTACLTPYVRGIVVIDNIPNSLDIQVQEVGEITDGDGKKMEYRFIGSALSPDGSDIVYEWFNDSIPVGELAPDYIGNNPVFAYQGGEHTVYLAAKNGAGAVAVLSTTFISADFTPPEAPSVYCMQFSPTNEIMPTFTWVPADAAEADAFRVQIGSESADGWISPTLPDQYTPKNSLLAVGVFEADVTIYVQVADTSGNWSDSGSMTISIDAVAPNAPVVFTTYVEDGIGYYLTNVSRPEFSWTPENAVDAVNYRWSENGGSWSETTLKTYKYTSEPTSGNYLIAVQTQDAAGNWSVSSEFTICIDRLAPAAPDLSVVPMTNSKRPEWNWVSTDVDTFGYQCELSNNVGVWIIRGLGEPSFIPSSDLTDGSYSLAVQARDKAGNWSSSDIATVEIDVKPPAKPLLSATTPTMELPSWSWNAGDADTVSFRYQLNSQAVGGWSTPSFTVKSFEYLGALAEADYTLYVQSQDAAGNWSELDPAILTVSVDLTPPAAPIVTVNNDVYVIFNLTSDVTWNWNDDSDTTGYRWQYNGEDEGNWNLLPNLISTTQPATFEGGNVFNLQARDEAGNWSASGTAFVVCGDEPSVTSSAIPGVVPYDEVVEGLGFILPQYSATVNGTSAEISIIDYVGDTLDNRKVGIHPNAASYKLTDSLGNQLVGTFFCPIEVLSPVAPVLQNPGFEDDDEGNASGWSWNVRGYQWRYSGSWGGWVSTSSIPAAYSGDYGLNLGIITVCNDNSYNGNIGNINHPVDSEDSVAGKSNVAFLPQSCKTKSMIVSFYITRTMGTLTQENIPVFANVTYKFSAISYANGVTHDSHNNLRAVAQDALTFAEGGTVISNSNGVEDAWHSHEVLFTPVADGFVSFQFEKTDISTGDRDNGGSYFDDAAIAVEAWPTN